MVSEVRYSPRKRNIVTVLQHSLSAWKGLGREGGVWVVYRGVIYTFNERQRHCHDLGSLLVGASDRNAGAWVDDHVLWPEVESHFFKLLLEFVSFANDIVPGLTAELFRVTGTFGPAHVVQMSR